MSKSYKIAIITGTCPPKSGGIAAAHFNLARCLQQQHEVAVFAFDDVDDEESEKIDVVRARTAGWLAVCMEWLARRWVRHYARCESAINCETIFRIVPSISKLNNAIRSFQPDFILCPDNCLPALALKKPNGSKLIWIAHHNYRRFEGNPLAVNFSWIDLQLAHRLERRAMDKADVVVAVSAYMAEVTKKTLGPSQPIRIIRNFVDSEHISVIQPSDLRSRLAIPGITPIIYIPSAGSSVKGERYTFELVRRLGAGGKAAFFLSGGISSPLRFELERLEPEIQIYAPGILMYDQNLSNVATCDFTVSPTLIENLSCALIESLALGVPVVTFDVGGNPELIQSGVNGYLIPYLDIENLVTAAESLISDRLGLTVMKDNARDSIAGILSPNRLLNEYETLFAGLKTDG